MFDRASRALEIGLGLKPEHQRVLIRTGWVLFVSGHVFWVCGFLAGFGLASPFARAEDVEELKKASVISARIQIQGEIRAQTKAYCQLPDGIAREYVLRRIDDLRAELYEIAKIRAPEPNCEPKPLATSSGLPEAALPPQ